MSLHTIVSNPDVLPPVFTGRRRLQRALLYLRTAELEQRARLAQLGGASHAATREVADRIGAAIAILQGMLREEIEP